MRRRIAVLLGLAAAAALLAWWNVVIGVVAGFAVGLRAGLTGLLDYVHSRRAGGSSSSG